MLDLIRERISNHLKFLGLNRMSNVLPDIMDQAQTKKSSYLDVLDQLLTEEVNNKQDQRFKRVLRLARLPFEKTIDEYDFSFHPQLDKRSVMNLFDLEFIQNKENVMFLGPPGVGKSHLAVALAIKAAQSGESIHWTSMVDLIERLRDKSYRDTRRNYYRNTLVVVDEVGYMSLQRQDAHLFFQFVCQRYEKKSIVMTSNKSFTQWKEVFSDPVIATAILDRLLHHCRVINIQGNSYRLKEFQQRKEQDPPRTGQESKVPEVASLSKR